MTDFSLRRRAAQYIRMSSDAQELSPLVQREAIRAYAEANCLDIVASYEDPGRSGLTLKQRPGLKRLLSDATQSSKAFDVVLVYDVSRWGRFQDTDASAYYEYHCRLNGVSVVYVKEPFSADDSPLNTLIKSLKRMMAAEYSRELKQKSRAGQEMAISRGFQMGSLPCIGFRRVAVSNESESGRELGQRERKPQLTDRVRWIPGPPDEVALVQAIFHEFATTTVTIKELVATLKQKNKRDRSGLVFTHQKLRALLRCEAFVGCFVWGRREDRTGRIRKEGEVGYTRRPASLQPLVSREIWERAQRKRDLGQRPRKTPEQLISELKSALELDPSLAIADLSGAGCATESAYRKHFGSFTAALRLAGKDPVPGGARERNVRSRSTGAAFRRDFIALMRAHAVHLTKLPRSRIFVLAGLIRLGILIIWRRRGRQGMVWHLAKDYELVCDYVIVVRMEADNSARDFLLMTIQQYFRHRPWFSEPEDEVRRIDSGAGLVEAVRCLPQPDAHVRRPCGYPRVRYPTEPFLGRTFDE